jgi:hypothetical protein
LNNKKIKKFVRDWYSRHNLINVYSNIAIQVIDGASQPAKKGRSGWYEISGRRVEYSVAKRAGKMAKYFPSTNRIEVGKDWLFENLPENLRIDLFCELAGIE